jgi:hypothetical protein
MSRQRINPLDEMIREQERRDTIEKGKSLVSVSSGGALSYSALAIALNSAKGNLAVAEDILGVPIKAIKQQIKKHPDLQEIVQNFELRREYIAERNIDNEIEGGNVALSLRLKEAKDAKAVPSYRQMTMEELELLQHDAARYIVRTMMLANPGATKELLWRLIEEEIAVSKAPRALAN